jgi:hypothetical protein
MIAGLRSPVGLQNLPSGLPWEINSLQCGIGTLIIYNFLASTDVRSLEDQLNLKYHLLAFLRMLLVDLVSNLLFLVSPGLCCELLY